MSAIVTNCHPTLAYECPREWERLVPTGYANVRFCHTCSRRVHLCETLDEAARCAEEGDYIAENVFDYCEEACA